MCAEKCVLLKGIKKEKKRKEEAKCMHACECYSQISGSWIRGWELSPILPWIIGFIQFRV